MLHLNESKCLMAIRAGITQAVRVNSYPPPDDFKKMESARILVTHFIVFKQYRLCYMLCMFVFVVRMKFSA